jgi:hypothetical protein
VQGDQEERQNHDHLREPEAQTKTGLITDSRIDSLFIKKRNAPDLTGRFMTVGTALWPEEPADMIRGNRQGCPAGMVRSKEKALTIYDEKQ